MRLFVSCMPFDSGKSGISVYVRNVVRELKNAGHDLTLLVGPDDARFFEGFRCVTAPSFTKTAPLRMLWHLFLAPFLVRKGAYDRILILAGNRGTFAFRRGTETLAVVHDLSQFHVEAKYDFLRMLYIKKLLPRFIRRADEIVAVSRSTADDLVRFWKIPEGKIFVRWNGIDRSKLPESCDGSEPAVLCVSRIEAPGKNHENLIRAWEKLPEDFTKKYRLVLAGSDWNGADRVHAQAERSPRRGSIVFAGFVSQEQLKHWYGHARLLAMPSRFEGFGLPVAEAMACGLPAACSQTSSLGEIAAGGAALTFDPGNPDSIAKAILSGCTDEPLRAETIAKGRLRAAEFDWKSHAEFLTSHFVRRSRVFGVDFSAGTMDDAVRWIEGVLSGPAASAKQACFINADCLNKAYRNAEYRALLNRSDMVWPDGVGVAMAARHFHNPAAGNVNGTDMLPLLCRKGWSLYLFGGAPGVAEKAAEKLRAQFPGCRIAGFHDGFFKPGKKSEIIREINSSGAQILLVAFGVPKQEFWIAENRSALTCRLAVGVGGLLDFASGRIPRAPQWMRNWKLEWLFRLRMEPCRLFRRYVLGNPLFLFRVHFGRKF